MRTKKIIKRFVFENSNRSKITLGTDVRLNPVSHRLQLQADSDDLYPTTADLYAKTWVANPLSVKQWLGFQVFATHEKDDLGAELSSLGFRLGDGTDEYYWSGSAWAVSVVNWNTEAEIANNIDTFSATSRNLQVVVNLVTTDQTVTPLLEEIRVLYASDIEFREDLIFRSLIPMLRDNIRPISDYLITKAATSATIDLANDYPLETPYNIVGIDSVYNHTDDPDQFVDLFQSYNTTTKVITLTGAVTAAKDVWIKFIWEPEIASTTSQEYTEIEKVPAVYLTDMNAIEPNRVGQSTSVANKDAGTAVKVPGPRQFDIEFSMRGVTDSARDQHRLADELRRFFLNNYIMLSVGLDEEYSILLTSEYDIRDTPGQSGIHSGFLRFKIVKVIFSQELENENVFTTNALNLAGDMNVTIS